MQIPLKQIDLNLANPRFGDPKTSQREALIELADADTISLARDILINGLNPTKRLAVFRSGKRFTTAEGNRRLSALRLLTNPALVDSLTISKRVKAELKQVPKEFSKKLSTIDCAVFNTEAEAAHWVRLEHTGRNGGIGTVAWDREQNRRFDSQFSVSKPKELQAIDYLRREFAGDGPILEKLANLPMTTFERLIGDPDVLAFFGLEWKSKKLVAHLHPGELRKAMRKVVDDLTHSDPKKRVTTRTLGTKSDRTEYLRTFDKRAKPDHGRVSTPWAIDGATEGPTVAPAKGKAAAKKQNPSTETRRKLLTAGCILRIDANARINDIYHNLKSDFDVEQYANAVSVLARLFIEMTANHYLQECAGKTEAELYDNRYKLATRLEDVVKHLTDAQKLSRNQAQAINKEFGNANSAFHPNSLNAFVHNPNLTPSSTDLKRGWNNIEPLVLAVWG